MDAVAASHVKQDERLTARAAQQQIELNRLKAHEQRGIELLRADPAQLRRQLEAARRVVDLWEEGQLCSADYIARWRAWLALPVKELVQQMCCEADGWGLAMRQNSPFTSTGSVAE